MSLPQQIEQIRSYEAAVDNLSTVMSLATKRWPYTGFHISPSIQRFTHVVFEDKSDETPSVRQQCELCDTFLILKLIYTSEGKKEFIRQMNIFRPSSTVRTSLKKLSNSHSLNHIMIHYKGRSIKPMYWDYALNKSIARVKFHLVHEDIHRETERKHSFVARMTSIQVVEPFAPISDNMCFGIYIDVDDIDSDLLEDLD